MTKVFVKVTMSFLLCRNLLGGGAVESQRRKLSPLPYVYLWSHVVGLLLTSGLHSILHSGRSWTRLGTICVGSCTQLPDVFRLKLPSDIRLAH